MTEHNRAQNCDDDVDDESGDDDIDDGDIDDLATMIVEDCLMNQYRLIHTLTPGLLTQEATE